MPGEGKGDETRAVKGGRRAYHSAVLWPGGAVRV
jgi:hypothetical protein